MIRRVFGLTGLCAVIGLVAGCGGGTGSTTSGTDSFSNLLSLDGRSVTGISRAEETDGTAPTPEQVCTQTFSDQNISRPQVTGPGGMGRPGALRWRLEQSWSPRISVSVPDGASRPASFSLSNIVMTLTVSDGERTATRTATVAGPITYAQVGDSGVYQTPQDVTPTLEFSEGDAETFHEIVTSAPPRNQVTMTLTYDASDELPDGSRLRFTLRRGKGHMDRPGKF